MVYGIACNRSDTGIERRGRDEVIVTGVDGNSQAQNINQDTNLKATVSQNLRYGKDCRR